MLKFLLLCVLKFIVFLFEFFVELNGGLLLLLMESNKVKFKTTIQSKRFHIQNLGDIDEVVFIDFYRDKTKVSHIDITEDFKSKIKKYSTIELF